jgi:hypothetical protein
MTVTAIPFLPGINREVTNYSGKGGYWDCDKVRFRSGFPEKIGGYSNAFPGATFNGVARTFWNWKTYLGDNLVALGTNQQYVILNPNPSVAGGYEFIDISPVQATTTINSPSLGTPFSTISGQAAIVVTDASYTPYVGQYVSFSCAGVISLNNITLYNNSYGPGSTPQYGPFEIIAVNSSTTYTIATPGQIANASGNGAGYAGSITISYKFTPGTAIASVYQGWGSGGWGLGGWGVGGYSTSPLHLWSQGNFGNDLIAGVRNGGLYYWTYVQGSYPSMVSMTSKANSITKTTQTVTAGGSAVSSFTVANSQGIDYGALVTLNTASGITTNGTSNIPANTYVNASPNYTGYTTITVSNPVTVNIGDTINFSYAGQTAPSEVGQILVSTLNQFVICLGATPYNPQTFSQNFNPLLVRWSDQSLPYEWTPATYNQAGSQVLSSGSYIVGGLVTRQEILIWTDKAVFSMQYVGAGFVFSFTLLMDNISLISPNAAITVNGGVYWMGNDKFYIYNGSVAPLPCSVRKFIFSNINKSQSDQIVCGQNEPFNEIWWHYPSKNSNNNDRYVVYNYLENIWHYGSMNRTAWLQSSLQPYPMAILSVKNSYLYTALTNSSSNTYLAVYDGSTYPFSGTLLLDGNNSSAEYISYFGVSNLSGYWVFNNVVRGVNGPLNTITNTPKAHAIYTQVQYVSPNQIVYHEVGTDDLTGGTDNPAPIQSYLQTSDIDLNGGDHFGYMWRMLPDFTFYGSTSYAPQVFLTVNPRVNSGSAYMTGGDIDNSTDSTVTSTQQPPTPPSTYPVEQYTGEIFCRVRGRQMNFNISSLGTGVAWQLGTMRFDIRPDGRR